jgi:cyanophycinase
VLIDQHFTQRGRLGRLLLLVAESPGQLGIGIDEDTAAVFTPDGVLEVLGKGTVTVVDGARAQSDAFEVRARRPVLVSGVVLHALPPGYRFDLRARALLPRLQAIPAAGRGQRAAPRPRRRAGGDEEQEASQ